MNYINQSELLYKAGYFFDHIYKDKQSFINKITKALYEYLNINKERFSCEDDTKNANELILLLDNYLKGGLKPQGYRETKPLDLKDHQRWTLYILVPDDVIAVLMGEGTEGHGTDKEIQLIADYLNQSFPSLSFSVQIESYEFIEREYSKKSGKEYRFLFKNEIDDAEKHVRIAFFLSPYINTKTDITKDRTSESGDYKVTLTIWEPENEDYIRKELLLNDGEFFRVGNNWFDDFWLLDFPYSLPISIKEGKVKIGYNTLIEKSFGRSLFRINDAINCWIKAVFLPDEKACQIAIYRDQEDNQHLIKITVASQKLQMQKGSFSSYRSPGLDKMDSSSIGKNTPENTSSFLRKDNDSKVPDDTAASILITDMMLDNVEHKADSAVDESEVIFLFQHTHRIIPFFSESIREALRRSKKAFREDGFEVWFGNNGDVVDDDRDTLLKLTVADINKPVKYVSRDRENDEFDINKKSFRIESGSRKTIKLKNGYFKLELGDLFNNLEALNRKDPNLGLFVDTEPDINRAMGYPFVLDKSSSAVIGRHQKCDIRLYDSPKYEWDNIGCSNFHAFLYYDIARKLYRIFNISQKFNIYLFNEESPENIVVIGPVAKNVNLTEAIKREKNVCNFVADFITAYPESFNSRELYHLDRIIIGSSVFRFVHRDYKQPESIGDINLYLAAVKRRTIEMANEVEQRIKALKKLKSNTKEILPVANFIEKLLQTVVHYRELIKTNIDNIAEKITLLLEVNPQDEVSYKKLQKYKEWLSDLYLQLSKVYEQYNEEFSRLEIKKKKPSSTAGDNPKPSANDSLPPLNLDSGREAQAQTRAKQNPAENGSVKHQDQESAEEERPDEELPKIRILIDEPDKVSAAINDQEIKTEKEEMIIPDIEKENVVSGDREEEPAHTEPQTDKPEPEEGKIILNESDVFSRLSVKIGVEKEQGTDVYWSFDRSPNRHALITGGTGHGKTYLMQCFLYELLKNGVPSVVIDYSRSFTIEEMTKTGFWEIAKEYINIVYVNTEGISINPFSPFRITVGGEGRFRISEKWEIAERLKETLSLIYKLSDQQTNAIAAAVESGLTRHGSGFKFEDLHEELRKLSNRVADKKTVDAVVRRLLSLFKGNPFKSELNNFSWKEIINKDNKITIIQLDGFTSNKIKKLITEFILWDAWNFMSVWGNEKTPLVLCLDEAQNLSFSNESPIYKILTEGRKFGFSGIFSMQFTKNQLSNQALNAIYQSSLKVFFTPPENLQKEQAKIMDPTDTFTDTILNNFQKIGIGEAIVMKKEKDVKELTFDITKITLLSERIRSFREAEDASAEKEPDKEKQIGNERLRSEINAAYEDSSNGKQTPAEEDKTKEKSIGIDDYIKHN